MTRVLRVLSLGVLGSLAGVLFYAFILIGVPWLFEHQPWVLLVALLFICVAIMGLLLESVFFPGGNNY